MITSRSFPQLRVSGISDHVYINGALHQAVKMNANGFFRALLMLPTQRCVDLLRIAVGVYAIDRIFKRRISELEDGIRGFRVVFEVRDLPFWDQPHIRDLVEETLSFLTADDWSIKFSNPTSDFGHQGFLPLPRFEPTDVILYSGGLDSAAGLANKLLGGANNVLLVTVGHQSGLHNRITRQLHGLRHLLRDYREDSVRLLHSTLTTSLEGGKSRRARLQEQTQRSRSFLFCAAAAVAARAYKLGSVKMLENGVGSINLPLMTGMLGSGLASRGAHPTFLRLMSELTAEATGGPMRFELPFSQITKAEMLTSLKAVKGLADWAQESRSCVHTSVRQAGKTHCGFCPACIERRQAFFCAGIVEQLDRYQVNALTDPIEAREKSDYLRMYRLDAMNWANRDQMVHQRMFNHLRLTAVPVDQDDEINALQLKNSHEALRTFGVAP